MAFVSQNSPDQDPNQQGQQNQPANQAPVTSAPNAGGSFSKATTGQPSNSSAAQPFTNLSSYLTANAPQIGDEARQIAGNLTGDYTAATGAIDKAGQNFGNDVKGGYTPNDPNVMSSFQANPTAVANDPAQATAFKGMYGDSYTGPSTFQDSSYYAPLSAQVQKGQETAAQVGTVPGLQSYLSQGKPGYTAGQATLDSVLLGGSPDAAQTIQAAATPYANLPAYLNSAVTAGNSAVQAAQQDAQGIKAATHGAFTDKVNATNARVNDEFTAASSARDAYNKALNDTQRTLDPVTQALRGYTGPADTARYLAPYQGQPQVNAPTQASAANPDDFAQTSALLSLAGGQSPTPLTLNPAESSLAGTYTPPTSVPSLDLNSLITQIAQGVTNDQFATLSPDQHFGGMLIPHDVMGRSKNLDAYSPDYASLMAALAKINPAEFQSGSILPGSPTQYFAR